MTITTRRYIYKEFTIRSGHMRVIIVTYSKRRKIRKLSSSLRNALSCQSHTSAGHTEFDYIKVPIILSNCEGLCSFLSSANHVPALSVASAFIFPPHRQWWYFCSMRPITCWYRTLEEHFMLMPNRSATEIADYTVMFLQEVLILKDFD